MGGGKMVKIILKKNKNTIICVMKNSVSESQVLSGFKKLKVEMEKLKPGFKFLVDYSLVTGFKPGVEAVVINAMKSTNEMGVGEIIRVLPDPDMEPGFKILTSQYYSKSVKSLIFRSLKEATDYLNKTASSK